MDQYKPQYLGAVLPEEPPKLKNFLDNKYEQFNKVYDLCKGSSDTISSVENAGGDGEELTVNIATDETTMEKLGELAANDSTVTVAGNSLTVSPSEQP